MTSSTFLRNGVVVSLNTSSNLRLGSGIAPAREMFARKVQVALGLDGIALDDDDDRYGRCGWRAYCNADRGVVDSISNKALFASSMTIAPRAVTGLASHGLLAAGMIADIATLDYKAISRDVIKGLLDESELVLARGATHHVTWLMVAGRPVVENGSVLGWIFAPPSRNWPRRWRHRNLSSPSRHGSCPTSRKCGSGRVIVRNCN